MIRVFEEHDLTAIMQIWLDTNIKTHYFISKEYWSDNFEMVESVLPQVEVYVYEDDVTKQIDGFIGLSNDYIEGIFVREGVQSNGIGKQLLEYAKCIKSNMSLSKMVLLMYTILNGPIDKRILPQLKRGNCLFVLQEM